LYKELGGFDVELARMEELDLGLKCWLLGYSIYLDPAVTIAVAKDANRMPSVTSVREIADRLRIARKHFSQSVWENWIERCRLRTQPDLWAKIWKMFEAKQDSVEVERSRLQSSRERDEFWYAKQFDLSWPKIGLDIDPPQLIEVDSVMALEPSPEPCERPSGSAFLNAYQPINYTTCPSNISAWNVIGGNLGTWGAMGDENACAARCSYALNVVQPITNLPQFHTWISNGKYYIVSTIDLAAYFLWKWCARDFTIGPGGTLASLPKAQALADLRTYISNHNATCAIIVWKAQGQTPGHCAVVSQSIVDPYTPYAAGGLGDGYLLS
jgi:hypothetical protein